MIRSQTLRARLLRSVRQARATGHASVCLHLLKRRAGGEQLRWPFYIIIRRRTLLVFVTRAHSVSPTEHEPVLLRRPWSSRPQPVPCKTCVTHWEAEIADAVPAGNVDPAANPAGAVHRSIRRTTLIRCTSTTTVSLSLHHETTSRRDADWPLDSAECGCLAISADADVPVCRELLDFLAL